MSVITEQVVSPHTIGHLYFVFLIFFALVCILGVWMWTHHRFLFPLVSRWHLANGESQQDIRGERLTVGYFSLPVFLFLKEVHHNLQLNIKDPSRKFSPCHFVLSFFNKYSFSLSPVGVGFLEVVVLIWRSHHHPHDIPISNVSLITL